MTDQTYVTSSQDSARKKFSTNGEGIPYVRQWFEKFERREDFARITAPSSSSGIAEEIIKACSERLKEIGMRARRRGKAWASLYWSGRQVEEEWRDREQLLTPGIHGKGN